MMAERLTGTYGNKRLHVEAAAAYDKVRAARSRRDSRSRRISELQGALGPMRAELATLASALAEARVQRVSGLSNNVEAAKAAHAFQAEKTGEAEAEFAALRGGKGVVDSRDLDETELQARDARGRLINSIVSDIRATLQADSRLREQIEVLYAVRQSGGDAGIGYYYEGDPYSTWPLALAATFGVLVETEAEHERIVNKYAALLPTIAQSR